MQILNAACCWGQINQSLFHSEVERLPEDARALPPTLKCSYFSLKMIFFHIASLIFTILKLQEAFKITLIRPNQQSWGMKWAFSWYMLHLSFAWGAGGGNICSVSYDFFSRTFLAAFCLWHILGDRLACSIFSFFRHIHGGKLDDIYKSV